MIKKFKIKLHRVLDRPSTTLCETNETCRGRGARGFSRTSVCNKVTKDLSKRLLVTWKNIARGEPQTQWGNNDIYIYIPCNSHKTYQVQHKSYPLKIHTLSISRFISIKLQFKHTVTCSFHFIICCNCIILDHCLEVSIS